MTTQRDQRLDTDPAHIRVMGSIRRMAISLTSRVLWQLTGARLPDGLETRQAEPFTGIGFFARPPANSRAEAVVLNLGADAEAPVIVAVRDEGTRSKVAGGLAEDETAAFTSKAIAHIKADGTIELRGYPQALPPEPMVKGTTYRTAESTLFTALNTFVAAVGVFNVAVVTQLPTLGTLPTAPTSPATVFAAALTAFEAAIAAFGAGSPTYLARVGKVE